MDPQQPPKVVRHETKPCGCIFEHYENGTQPGLAPCLPCGLIELAKLSANISNICHAMGQNMAAKRDAAQNQAILDNLGNLRGK